MKKISIGVVALIAIFASSNQSISAAPTARQSALNEEFTSAAESTINGVVSIKSYATIRPQQRGFGGFGGFNDPLFDFFFGDGSQSYPNRQQQRRRGNNSDSSSDTERQQERGLGSGVIISSDGYIITNNHVIDGADKLEVILNDNRTFPATVIGTDPQTDLAVVKIDATGLHVIPMGNSDNLKIGEWVLAVGNPFGLTSTVTAGIVSAKARTISGGQSSGKMSIESFIQTDAAVNPGNSGGALVNLSGELVGINSAIYSQTGSYTGYSFAIPTSIVKKISSDLMKFRTVQRAFLGITFTELTDKEAKERGITATTDGLLVNKVTDHSAAMEAGLKEGDVIVAIDGVATHNQSQLLEQISRHSPGEKIVITYIRDNKKLTATTTLRNNAGGTTLTQASSMADLGCAFMPMKADALRAIGVSNGVQVAGLKDGPMKEAGVKNGLVITEINGQRITSVDDIERTFNQVTSAESTDNVMFITGVYPTGRKAYYAVNLEK